MKRLTSLHRTWINRSVGILLGGSLLFGMLPAIAQTTVRLRLPNLSAPGNRESGSTRSTTCIAPNEQLVALVPESNYGLTQSGYPTLYFYLPPTAAQQVKFVVLNENTNELFYEGRFSVNGDSGIVSVSIPDNGLQQPLAQDTPYIWYMAIVCDAADPSADVVVEGRVMRVAPVSATEAAAEPSLPAIYAESGLWYDALAASAVLKRRDDTSAWNTLLDAVELNDLIQIPLLTDNLTPEEQSSLLVRH